MVIFVPDWASLVAQTVKSLPANAGDLGNPLQYSCLASLIAQLVKNPPAMQVTPVWFLGQEDLLEKG